PAMSLAQADALMTQPGALFEMEELDIRGVPTRVWKNGPKTFRELFRAARRYGHGREFLVLEDDRVAFEGFARATLTLAHALDGAGVRKGDRVAVIMRNLPEWPVAFFAATLLGAIVVPMNAWWTGPELHYGLVDSGARVAVVDSERLQRLFEHLPECPDLERVF